MSDDELYMFEVKPPLMLAKTADFLYRNSVAYISGDPAVDLTEDELQGFLSLSEQLLISIGVFPPEWTHLTRRPEK